MPDSAVKTAVYQMGLDASQYKREADAVDAANKKMVGSTAQVTVAEEKVTQATRTTADGFSKLEARYDSLIKIEQRRTAAIQQATRFLQEGIITQERYAAQITRINTYFDRQVASAGAASRGLMAVQAAGNAVNMAMFGLAARLGPVGIALAALGPVGLAAGAAIGVTVGLGMHAIKSAGALGELAEQLGVTTTDLQVFQFAAVQSGIKTTELENGLAKFTRTVGDAVKGNKAAIESFENLGIGVLSAGDKTRSQIDIYLDVADAISKIEDPIKQASAATDFFGDRVGQRLLPLLKLGADGFSEMALEAHRLGIVLTQEQIKAANAAADATDRLTFRVDHYVQIAGANFIQWAEDAVDATANWGESLDQAVVDFLNWADTVAGFKIPSLFDPREFLVPTPPSPAGSSGPRPGDFSVQDRGLVRTYNPPITSDVETAAKAAAAAREAERKATEAAILSLDDYIESLKEEQRQLDMSERDRFIRNAQLKAEQLALKGTIGDVEKYVDAVKKEAAALFDARKAADDAAEAAKKLADEKKKALEEQRRAAEEQQKLLLEPFKNALEGMQEAFSDFFFDIFDNGLKSTKNFAQAMLEIFKRLAAQIAALLIFQPIVNDIVGNLGTGNISQGQLPGLGSLGSLFNFDPFNLFSSGSSTVPKTGGGPDIATQGTGSFDTSSALASAAVIGMAALNLAQDQSGTNIGSLIGAGIGTVVLGPLGALLGSVLGGLLGGLFDSSSPPYAVGGINFGSGQAGITGFTAGKGGSVSQIQSPAEAAVTAMNAILDQLGASFTGPITKANGTAPPYSTALVLQNGLYRARVGGVDIAGTSSKDPQEAIIAFIVAAIQGGLKQSLIVGLSDTFKTVFQQIDVKTITEAELTKTLDLASFYDSLLMGTKTVTEAEKALDLLEKQFAELKTFAEEFGLSLQVVADGLAAAQQKLTDDFNKSVTQQILAFTDPLQAALNELEDAQKKRLEEAKVLGADLVLLERLNGLERQRVIEQFAQQATDSLIEFYRRITYGDLALASPTNTLTGTRATFEAAAAQAMAGDFNARGNLTGYADAYLQASQSVNASSPAYFQDLARVQEVIGSLIGTTSQMSLTDAVVTGNTEIVRLLAANNNQVQDLIRITQEQAETIDTLTGQIERLLAA